MGGFTPIDDFWEVEVIAKVTCANLLGQQLRSDLEWGGGKSSNKPDAYWIVYGIRRDNPDPQGPKDFQVRIPVSGAGPNICKK